MAHIVQVISSLETIADQDQNRMGLVAYLLNSAQNQMEQNKKREKKEVGVNYLVPFQGCLLKVKSMQKTRN